MNLIRNYYNILDIIDYDKIPFYFELFEREFVLDNNGVKKISKNDDGRLIKVFRIYFKDKRMFFFTTNELLKKLIDDDDNDDEEVEEVEEIENRIEEVIDKRKFKKVKKLNENFEIINMIYIDTFLNRIFNIIEFNKKFNKINFKYTKSFYREFSIMKSYLDKNFKKIQKKYNYSINVNMSDKFNKKVKILDYFKTDVSIDFGSFFYTCYCFYYIILNLQQFENYYDLNDDIFEKIKDYKAIEFYQRVDDKINVNERILKNKIIKFQIILDLLIKDRIMFSICINSCLIDHGCIVKLNEMIQIMSK